MGITIAYRGSLADLSRVEDFEDRLIDFALEFGGQAQIWRSHADKDPRRTVRGVILNLAPGLESASLLLSPEGWLISLTDIEDAECGRLKEPPWCFTKTQFGPLEGHVALVEMFSALQREFLPGLQVTDEGGYWPTRDRGELKRRHSFLKQAIGKMGEGLQRYGLSREAAEDPDILLRHIERVAAQVHRTLMRPSEHPPVICSDDETGGELDAAATEALWDNLYKQNRRQQERMQRSIEDRLNSGEEPDEAFDNALADLGLEIPGEDSDSADEPESFGLEPSGDEPEDSSFDAEDDERHPLLQGATDLLHRLHTVFRGADRRFEPPLQTLFQGAGDTMGGLAQALSNRHDDEDDPDDYGLRLVQLKRALRGTAFARGSLFSLRAAVSEDVMDELQKTLARLEGDIFSKLSALRAELGAEEQ